MIWLPGDWLRTETNVRIVAIKPMTPAPSAISGRLSSMGKW